MLKFYCKQNGERKKRNWNWFLPNLDKNLGQKCSACEEHFRNKQGCEQIISNCFPLVAGGECMDTLIKSDLDCIFFLQEYNLLLLQQNSKEFCMHF